ncbi:unnamed protein product, partial [Timema podura]|nr:unnamed protein product [Timema podura]
MCSEVLRSKTKLFEFRNVTSVQNKQCLIVSITVIVTSYWNALSSKISKETSFVPMIRSRYLHQQLNYSLELRSLRLLQRSIAWRGRNKGKCGKQRHDVIHRRRICDRRVNEHHGGQAELNVGCIWRVSEFYQYLLETLFTPLFQGVFFPKRDDLSCLQYSILEVVCVRSLSSQLSKCKPLFFKEPHCNLVGMNNTLPYPQCCPHYDCAKGRLLLLK